MEDTPNNLVPFPQTAAQHNAPLVGAVTLTPTADETRTKLLELFDQFRPQLSAYHDYAQRCAALSEEYHKLRIAEALRTPVEELTLAVTLDIRETPKSLDTKLAQLAGVTIKRIIFDRVKGAYLLFA
jgi:hypothetical protein